MAAVGIPLYIYRVIDGQLHGGFHAVVFPFDNVSFITSMSKAAASREQRAKNAQPKKTSRVVYPEKGLDSAWRP